MQLWRMVALVLALVPCCAGHATVRPSPPDMEPPVGRWSGGLGRSEGEHPFWRAMTLSIAADRSGQTRCTVFVAGAERPARLEVLAPGVLRLSGVDPELGPLELRGEPEGNEWSGTFEAARHAGEFSLVRARPVGRGELEALGGIYRFPEGGRVAVGPAWPHLVLPDGIPRLVMQDLEAGTVRVLTARGDGCFTTGPRFADPLPAERELHFRRVEGASDVELTITAGSTTRAGLRAPAPRRRDVNVPAGDVTLAGTLLLPPGPGPHPAVLFVHGSGPQPREAALRFWPAAFVDRGLAFLAVDKRGVGASTGTYELPDGRSDDEDHMARRAGDVAATVEFLRGCEGIDAERVGLFGFSQAGWVAPQAAALCSPAFTVVIGGGATALDVENVFSELSGEMWGSGLSLDEVYRRLETYSPERPAFDDVIGSQTTPGLWLYGDLDRSNPSRACARVVRDAAERLQRPFDVVIVPDANHAVWECRVGNGHEYGALERVHPRLYATLWAWLESRAVLP